MEKSQVNEALTLLQQQKFNQNLQKPLTKIAIVKKYDLSVPACINNPDLLKTYNETDLEFTYVYECAKKLKPLKGIEVNLQQVEFWYVEFLRIGWKKKDFDKQYEAVKRAKLFNRIDLENWLDAEVTYNEIDLNVEVDRRINRMIQNGESLKNEPVLSEEEKKWVELAAIKTLEFNFKNRRALLMDDYREQFKREYLAKLSEKKRKIATMTDKQKMEILDNAIDKGKIHLTDKAGFEYMAVLHHLEDYVDLLD